MTDENVTDGNVASENVTGRAAGRPADPCNCFALRAAARHVTALYDQLLEPVGLRVTQFSILATLRQAGPLTVNALADAMVMDRTTLTRAMQPLARDGLVRVAPAESDRRARDVRLTRAGVQRVRAARAAWARAQARFEEEFGEARAAELRTLLRAVVER